MFHLPNPRSARALVLAATLVALGPATSAHALTSTPTTTYVPSSANPVPTCCGTTTTVAPPTAAPGAAAPPGEARIPSSKPGGSLSTGAIAIAVLAALLVLGCVAWAISRRRALEPHWTSSLRHAMAEAGFHASATWAEFTDWVKLGH
jgi:hypothetical protein